MRRNWRTSIVTFLVIITMAVVVVLIRWRVADKSSEVALSASWAAVISTLRSLGTTINSRNLDFSDISSRTADYYARLKGLRKSLAQVQVSKKYVQTKSELVGLIDESLALLDGIKNSSDSWKSANFRELEIEITSVQEAAQGIFSSWPAGEAKLLQPDLEVLTGLPTSFNKMRLARKPQEPKGMVVVGGVPPGWVLVPTPSRPGIEVAYSTQVIDYLRSMQSLLRGYKQLRGDLEDYIAVAKKVGRVLDSAYTVQFDNAYASRQNILNAISSLNPPPEYFGRHQRAIACLERGMASMEALRNGDYQTFHELSQENTPALSRVMRDYGL